MEFNLTDYLIHDGEYHGYVATWDGKTLRVWVDGVKTETPQELEKP